MKYTLTDVEYAPAEAGINQVQVCAKCGLLLGYHYQHANGRITCVKYASPDIGRPIGAVSITGPRA